MSGRMLTKREIFMPTWGRVAFTLLPLLYAGLWWFFAFSPYDMNWLPDFLSIPIAVLVIAMVLVTPFLTMPFLVVLEPLGLSDSWGLGGPGAVIVIVGYMIILYFIFPTRKIVWREFRMMLRR